MKMIKALLLTVICGISSSFIMAKENNIQKDFIVALKKSDISSLKNLIKEGADINAPLDVDISYADDDRTIKVSPFMFAIIKNKPKVAKALLEVKKKLNIDLNKALDEAINKGCLGIVKALIKAGVDINHKDKYGDTPLISAIKCANPLAEFYGQAQARSKSRWVDHKYIIQALLDAGANINHANKDGNTALMEAVKNHDLNTVLELLKKPSITKGSFFGFGEKPINAANKDGNTALILAIKYIQTSYYDNHGYHTCINSQKISEELLKTPGIDVYHANNNGETAIKLLENLKKKSSF